MAARIDDNDQRVSCQGRVDVISFATLARFFSDNGTPPINRSNLLHLIVQSFCELVVNNGYSERVGTIEEALNILARHGIVFKHGSDAHRSVVRMLQDESINLESQDNKDDGASVEDMEAHMTQFLNKQD